MQAYLACDCLIVVPLTLVVNTIPAALHKGLKVNQTYLVPGEAVVGAYGEGALVVAAATGRAGAAVSCFAVRSPGYSCLAGAGGRFLAALPGGVCRLWVERAVYLRAWIEGGWFSQQSSSK